MDCRTCGADLPPHAAYCATCGARVELGSVLGVGTDLPPRRVAESPAAAVQRAEASGTAYAEQFGDHQHEPQRPGHSRSSILAMIATFVVLTLIGTFALTRIVGSDSPEPAASVTPTTAMEGEESPSTEASSSAAGTESATPESPSTSPTSPSATSGAIPAGARKCSTSGDDSVATAYAGTDRTSCEFAASVREAYRAAGTPDAATTLRAYSPVTKKWYSLSCDGGAPVRCTSTTNAVVLLSP
ncbi:zinc ribbon domain-containing protein [Knoellia subterranea]|uniref:Zinc-ribbon domain-containing protein n=1 Tax=Knoellia subterranea KCTC 19937 TaxID=1385521 RepID=A0A0A0JJ35_9MICO|nr:zinc ribbon domain-containing protein [Knoellia subterranea]KGN35676.1 hypothetical protein N803_06295 [Knoellia subterranea KCTC 19937]